MIKAFSVVACLASAIGLHAASVTFATPTGSVDSAGDPVSAQAAFVTGGDTLTLDLTNLVSASTFKDAGQLLTDLFFTLGTPSTGSSAVTSSDATFVSIDKKGNATNTTGTSQSGNANDHIGWVLSLSSGTFHLDGLAGGASANPAQEILGGAVGDTSYPSANGSIADNPAHNPFVQGTGHWVLSIPGITANTVVTSATFSFGTTPGDDIPGRSVVPEPRYTLFLLSGLVAGILLLRRRRLSGN